MYHATVAAAALHQVLLRTMTKALRDDKVVAQNVHCPCVSGPLYALLGLQYYWGAQILRKVARSIGRCPSSSKLIR